MSVLAAEYKNKSTTSYLPDVLLQVIAQYLRLKDRIAFMSCNHATLHACSNAMAWKHVDARLMVRFLPNEAPVARVCHHPSVDLPWIGHPNSKLNYCIPDERRHFLCEMPETLPFLEDAAEQFKSLCIDSHGTIQPDFQTRVHHLLPVEISYGELGRIDADESTQTLNHMLLERFAPRVCAFSIDSDRGDPRYDIQEYRFFEASPY
jgi:hypothetical protein